MGPADADIAVALESSGTPGSAEPMGSRPAISAIGVACAPDAEELEGCETMENHPGRLMEHPVCTPLSS